MRKKAAAGALLVVIGILAALSVFDRALESPVLNTLDRRGDRYFEDTIKRTVVTFAIVRGLNGIISVIQGTRVSVSAVAGISLAVGELLDPINDLLERFSWVMLIASTSLGIQKILMEMGQWMGFKIGLSLSMLVIFISLWLPHGIGVRLKSIGYRLILISFLVRFCMPVSALLNDGIYHLFLEHRYTLSVELLEKANRQIKDMDITGTGAIGAGKQTDTIDLLIELFGGSKNNTAVKDRITALKAKIADYATHILNLVVVFMVQTVVIPLVMLWIVVRLFGWIIRRDQGALPAVVQQT